MKPSMWCFRNLMKPITSSTSKQKRPITQENRTLLLFFLSDFYPHRPILLHPIPGTFKGSLVQTPPTGSGLLLPSHSVTPSLLFRWSPLSLSLPSYLPLPWWAFDHYQENNWWESSPEHHTPKLRPWPLATRFPTTSGVISVYCNCLIWESLSS